MTAETMRRWVLGCCGVAIAASAGGARGAIVEYRFNSTGTTSPSTGTDTTSVSFRDAANAAADLHGAPGSGVTGGLGLPGSATDRAFDNTASTGMGNAGTGGVALHLADNDNIDGLSSFTLSGWFKTDTTAGLNGFARLFLNRGSNLGYHLLSGDLVGEFRPAVDATEATDIPGWADTQKWVFFAMAYDGAQTANNARFYKGYRNPSEAPGGNAAVQLVSTITLNQGASDDDGIALALGNQASRDRPFDGFLDNLRIEGSKVDASGALSLANLEDLRSADVPEPTSAALAGAAVAGLLLGRRRPR